jgi:transcription antitermination factor NusG
MNGDDMDRQMDQQIDAARDSLWYAAFTRSRHEKVAASMLSALGICHLLPLTTEVRRWSDRKQKVSVPLFPGYIFVKIVKSSDELLRILKVPGVISFVGSTGGPVVIPKEEIESIRTVLAQGIGLSPYPFLAVGDRVRIVH